MNITTRVKDGVTILDLSGRFVGGAGLQQTVQGLVSKGVTKILLNLEGVDWMDSSALGELTAVKQTTGVKLLHVKGTVREVLTLARVLSSFEVFDDEIDAISSLRG